jgi:hypothetical protein
LSYQSDRQLGRLFAYHGFSTAERQAGNPKTLRMALVFELGREVTDEEWNLHGSAVRTRRKDQTGHLLRAVDSATREFLRALPGNPDDDGPPWDAPNQRIVDDWLAVPRLCVTALRELGLAPFLVRGAAKALTLKPLLRVPPDEARKYEKDPAALVVRWMLDDASRVVKHREVARILSEYRGRGASPRFIVALSFVPALVFETLSVRRVFEANRQAFADRIRHYSNPSTRLPSTDPLTAEWLQLRQSGVPPFDHMSDDDIKTLAARSLRQLPRERERELYASIGLDKTPSSAPSRHDFWDIVALPLVRYLEPFAPRRKTGATSPVIQNEHSATRAACCGCA